MKTEIILKEVNPLIVQAESLSITDADSMRDATVLLSQVNCHLDRVTAEREKVTKPLNEALKAERARWKPIEDILNSAISTLRSTISVYQTAEIKRADEEKAKLASRVGDGKGKLQFTTAVRKMSEIEVPDAKVVTDVGGLTFRATQVLVITDATLIPREYLLVDERKVLEALKRGVVVAGAHVETIQVPVNRR